MQIPVAHSLVVAQKPHAGTVPGGAVEPPVPPAPALDELLLASSSLEHPAVAAPATRATKTRRRLTQIVMALPNHELIAAATPY
jgi:hypothetical protein